MPRSSRQIAQPRVTWESVPPAEGLRAEDTKRTAVDLVLSQRSAWIVLPILLVAWGLRLFVYAPDELGLDGYLSVGLTQLPLDRFLNFLARDVHPPLYYLLLDGWLAVVGTNVLVARWLGLAAGLLTLVVLYRLVVPLAGHRGTTLALLMLMLSPAHVVTSATARDFSLGLLLSVSTLLVWRALDRPHVDTAYWRLLAALAALTALAMATWYFHLVFLAVMMVDAVVRGHARRGKLVATGAGLAAQIPWLALALPLLVSKIAGGVTATGAPPALVSGVETAAGVGQALGGIAPGPLPEATGSAAWLLLMIVGLIVGLRQAGTTARWARLAFLGCLLGFAGTYALTSAWAEPDLLGRYCLIVLPWALLAHAWVLGHLNRVLNPAVVSPSTLLIGARQWPILLVGLVLVAQTAVFLAVARSIPIAWDTEPAIETLVANRRPGDAVVFTDHTKLGVYASRSSGDSSAVSIHIAGPSFLREDVPVLTERLLGPLLARHQRVWLTYDLPVDQSSVDEIQRWLGAERFLVWHAERDSVVVRLFAPGPSLAVKAMDARFGEVIDLESASTSPSARTGGPVFVELTWRSIRQPDADYQVFAHLIDEHGERLAQRDGAPVLGSRPTTTWRPGESVVDRFVVPVPPEARPGPYSLVIGLYRESGRLPLASGGDSLTLGPILVEE